MKAKFACADFTFPLLQHEHALDLIANLGFTGVDLGLFEQRSHLWPSKEFKSLQKNARRLKRSLADRGLVAADVFLQMRPDFTPYAINQPSAARRRVARDWFLKTLEYADALGCHHVTTLPGVVFEDEGRAASLARSVDELAWRVAESRGAGIVFGTEAHVGSIVPTPETAEDLVRRVPGLTLTLDYTHFTRAGVPDLKIEPLVKYASHVHMRGACRGRLQCNFRENTIDYPRMVKAMAKAGYRGWIGVEYIWIDWEKCNESDTISETIQMKNLLQQAAAKL